MDILTVCRTLRAQTHYDNQGEFDVSLYSNHSNLHDFNTSIISSDLK